MAESDEDLHMALAFALLDIHRGKEDFLKAIAKDMNNRLNTSRFNKRSVESRLRSRLIHKGYGKLRGLKDRGTEWLQPGSFSKELFDATNMYRQEFGINNLPQNLVNQSQLTSPTLPTVLSSPNPSTMQDAHVSLALCPPEIGPDGLQRHYDLSEQLQHPSFEHEMAAVNRIQDIQQRTVSHANATEHTASIASEKRGVDIHDKGSEIIALGLEADAQCNSRLSTLEHHSTLDENDSIDTIFFDSDLISSPKDEIDRVRVEINVLKEENRSLKEKSQASLDHVASLKEVIKEMSDKVEAEHKRLRPFEKKMESEDFGKDFGMLLRDMLVRDGEREEMRTTFNAIFGNSTNRHFPRRPPLDESQAHWERLRGKLAYAFEHEIELPAHLRLHRLCGGFENYMEAMLGCKAIEDPITNELQAKISPLHFTQAFAGVFLCLKVFDSPYPNFAHGYRRQLEKLYTLVAVKDVPSQVEALHVAGIAQLANEASFQQDELPEKAKQWAREFRQLFTLLLLDAPESAQHWGPANLEQRFALLEGCFMEAAQLKISRLTSPLKFRFRIQWVSAHAKFEESWMAAENGDSFSGHDIRRLKIRLCLFPAFLQDEQDASPATLGPAGHASSVVYDQRFSVGSTKDSLEVASSRMDWMHAMLIAKAVVLVELTE